MEVWGIDFSTKAIDVLEVALDDETNIWWHHVLEGKTLEERIRYLDATDDAGYPLTSLPRRNSNLWDNVLAVGIERPIGRFSSDQLSMVLGALITRVPQSTLMKLWTPPAWKKQCGMPGNCDKAHVARWVSEQIPGHPLLESQDACDAYAIAYATRSVTELAPTDDSPTPFTEEASTP
jgi:hypothetical protein